VFLGHFALGLAAKKVDPSVSLGTYFLAAQLPDVLWPGFLLAGVEHVSIVPGDTAVTPLRFDSYPYSHSLLAVVLWAGLLAGLHWARRRSKAAGLLAVLVISHWVLDFASHRPDMPLAPGDALRLGLGLWHSVPATLMVESLLFLGGVALYAGATQARDAAGRYGFGGLVTFLAVIYALNIFGPPPPNVLAIAVAGLLGTALLLLWAFWADRHRTTRTP
jgi:hypothetical protein